MPSASDPLFPASDFNFSELYGAYTYYVQWCVTNNDVYNNKRY